ncbi:PhzF family phenazine biosynthesis protein [Marinobacterium sp. D7]|uniref:PhzF family phenazine biosynthesis protein n=1 Tax=Marinobacterium ramblicola TaxID=2849041 RepID=UPI001C2DC138|nr:PhzF family phenazine biosynthesis protein [Marinobacterium ramblicola]MBV1787208.1 PhzF family phenazine biosynthesis protein [Marinobacterium ramblicola]
MKIEVPIVNAFTDGQLGGNPAGVVLDAERFTREQKQHIAAAVGLSETAFVSPSGKADFMLEFFTPSRQIAHCGHATVATFNYLRQIGSLTKPHAVKETIDGCREIRLEQTQAYMEQLAPRYTALSEQSHAQLLRGLGLHNTQLLPDAAPLVVNTGNAFVVLGVKDVSTLANLRVDQSVISELSEALELIGIYLFTLHTAAQGRHASTRMFAPRYGIAEESATGMAAGPLACYLHDQLGIREQRYLIEQGHFMPVPSPSLIEVRLDTANGDAIRGLMAGGSAALSDTRPVEIAD